MTIKNGDPSLTAERELRVLCAEDDEALGFMLETALGRAGHAVERVSDGLEALRRVTADVHFFDVVLTDHRMPRMTGLQLVEKLRGLGFVGRIVVHSSELKEQDARAYRVFSVDFITKPAALIQLLSTVRRAKGAIA